MYRILTRNLPKERRVTGYQFDNLGPGVLSVWNVADGQQVIRERVRALAVSLETNDGERLAYAIYWIDKAG
jgi:hypothetical protein